MRTFIKLLLATAVTVAVTTVGFAVANPAAACSNHNNDHCYGEAGTSGTSNTIGLMSYETLHCTMTAPLHNFATDEIWLIGTNSGTWLESGYMITNQGDVSGVPGSQFAAFWAKSVSGRYTSAVLQRNPATAGNFYVQPNASINGYDVGFTSEYGYTHNHQIANNGLRAHALVYGSETTANSGAQTGFDGSPAWEDSGTNWHGGMSSSDISYHVDPPNRFSWTAGHGHNNYTSGPTC